MSPQRLRCEWPTSKWWCGCQEQPWSRVNEIFINQILSIDQGPPLVSWNRTISSGGWSLSKGGGCARDTKTQVCPESSFQPRLFCWQRIHSFYISIELNRLAVFQCVQKVHRHSQLLTRLQTQGTTGTQARRKPRLIH